MTGRWLRATAVTIALAACRIETAAPGGNAAASGAFTPSGEVWVYTSMYHPVIDALDPLIRRVLPQVNVRWYQAGSEKVANRLDAELAAGGTPADLLLTSDPFLYERLKRRRIHALRFAQRAADPARADRSRRELHRLPGVDDGPRLPRRRQ
jgi:hypothetical protein